MTRSGITLVTGARGFIGTCLVARLRSEGRRLRLLSSRAPVPASDSHEWVHADLAEDPDWPALLADVDTVFHLAAQTSAARCLRDPEQSRRINLEPVRALIAAARSSPRSLRVVFASTETVAGLHATTLHDKLVDAPLTPYDEHKRAAELLLLEAVERGRLRAASLRMTTIYGPGPRPRARDRGVIAIMIERALRGDPLTVYGSGELERDFLYLDDAVTAMLAAERSVDALAGEHYLVGAGRSLSLLEAFARVAAQASAVLGRAVPLVHVEPPPELLAIDGRSVRVDASRFRQRSAWQPEVDFDLGLQRTLRWHVAERREHQ